MRYAFIDQYRDSYPVQALFTVLQASDGHFATWHKSANLNESR